MKEKPNRKQIVIWCVGYTLAAAFLLTGIVLLATGTVTFIPFLALFCAGLTAAITAYRWAKSLRQSGGMADPRENLQVALKEACLAKKKIADPYAAAEPYLAAKGFRADTLADCVVRYQTKTHKNFDTACRRYFVYRQGGARSSLQAFTQAVQAFAAQADGRDDVCSNGKAQAVHLVLALFAVPSVSAEDQAFLQDYFCRQAHEIADGAAATLIMPLLYDKNTRLVTGVVTRGFGVYKLTQEFMRGLFCGDSVPFQVQPLRLPSEPPAATDRDL